MDDFRRHGTEVFCKNGPKCTGCCNDKKLARKRARRRLKVRLRKELDSE